MKETFGMRVYHEYVAWAMRSGFKWIRFSREGNYLTIWSLRMQHYQQSVVDKECADRFENWYNWMKGRSK